ISSMPEIAGEAALFADPADPESIALQLEEIFIHPELRAALIEKGKQQLTRFSWQKTADLLWNSIEKTIKQKK
ncbi:MAG: glycosyltransferase family 1 protein, partial [Bacteroidales bacterium]|nr:glycosyltransferase family 1 protein [Bacteroidales bacterium]